MEKIQASNMITPSDIVSPYMDQHGRVQAAATMGRHQQDSKLERRCSIPARLRLMRQVPGENQPITKRSPFKCTRYNSLNRESRLSLGSRSDVENHHNHSNHRHHTACNRSYSTGRRRPCDARNDKSTSPASSSASDSAFSQSQTTLESEIDQSNSFRRSLGKDSNHLFNGEQKGSSSNLLFGCPMGGGGGNLSISDEDDTNQFKIIWRNLSYRVPKKRFSRSLAWIQRQKEALWPFKGTVDDGLAAYDSRVVVGQDHEIDESPLKTTMALKPRELIFSQLNGCVKSGQLTAILGPSGAGKTTFLKCLTNTIYKGVSGSIDVTGGIASSHRLKLCIIPQKDYLFDNLTVMENLIFASKIKNTEEEFNHLENVERVASLLGLQACLRLKTSRLSGGQYKRVSIAQELLSKPDILILDEPTSGLDSLTCFKTVSVLRDLVNKSRAGLIPPLAIVMTIHQPQIKIFNLFHHVYIMSSLGQCVYEGRPEFLIDIVADCCKLLPPPDDLNPASFIIDLASEVYGTIPIDQLSKLQRENFNLIYPEQPSQLPKRSNRILDNLLDIHPRSEDNVKNKESGSKQIIEMGAKSLVLGDNTGLQISGRLKRRLSHDNCFWLHTSLLVKRLWISMRRDSLLMTTRVSFHLIIPFVFYFIYSQKSGAANACPHVEREFDFQSMASESNMKRLAAQHNELILTFENVSLFFLLLYSFSMCVLAVTALSFPLNMQILLKETSNGWYSMPRFVMAKTLADLPIELAMPMTSVAIAYMLTGQPSSYFCWRMLIVTAVMTLCSLISQTQGLLFGAYFMNNVQAAVFVSQASSLPWILLSGFTTRVSELPTVLRWLSFGSIYRLGIESVVAVRYGFGMCPCDQEVVNDTPAKIVGLPDQLRSLMRYYLEMYSESSSLPAANNSTGDVFEKLASTLSRANTYGVDIVSCHDVRPFILSAREVDEETLPLFVTILVVIFVTLKILLFCVVRFRAG